MSYKEVIEKYGENVGVELLDFIEEEYGENGADLFKCDEGEFNEVVAEFIQNKEL
ncbi:hypothetical protein N9Z65_00690 [bacterium]|nr:hypothetical protein [bacterium]